MTLKPMADLDHTLSNTEKSGDPSSCCLRALFPPLGAAVGLQDSLA